MLLTIQGIEDRDVCEGAIGLEGPILAQDLRKMSIPSKTQELFCLTIFGLCKWPAVAPYSVPFPKPKPQKSRPVPSGQPPLKIPHFSDIHVDLSYEEGSNWNCTKPMCCRSWTDADKPGKTNYPAGPYGNTRCEPPVTLEESMYSAIKPLVSDPGFSLFTGDAIESFVWGITKTEIVNNLADANGRMEQIGQVFSAVGNHESSPVNAFPPMAVNAGGNSWLYNPLSTYWNEEIGSVPASSLDRNSGSYATMWGNSNLRIISVNTNYWHKNNFWLYEQTMERDPSGLLVWLVNELQGAEDKNQRVWIIGHMPMGSGDALHDQSNYFDQIVQRYEGTIAAMFWGHTHVDEMQLSYRDYRAKSFSTASVAAYVAPALAPDSGPPAFKVYDVDPVTFGVLDSTTYYTDMSSPDFQTYPQWKKLYSVKEAYGPLVNPPVTDKAAELTPAFWHNVTAMFETNDNAFQQYYARKRRALSNPPTCTGDCKTTEICNIRAGESQFNCVPVVKGIHFKRDLEGRSEVRLREGFQDGCEGSHAVRILAQAVGHKEIFGRVMEEQLDPRDIDKVLSGDGIPLMPSKY